MYSPGLELANALLCLQYNRLINDMLAVYNGASICAQKDPFTCGLRLQPDLIQIMAKSRNWEELSFVWTEWRRNTGQNIKESYEQLVHLTNEAARLNSKYVLDHTHAYHQCNKISIELM